MGGSRFVLPGCGIHPPGASVAEFSDSAAEADGWGCHWRLPYIFSSRFQSLLTIYSQLGNASNFGHIFNFKKARLVSDVLGRAFGTNILLSFTDATERCDPVCCEMHSACMKHSYNDWTSCRVLFRMLGFGRRWPVNMRSQEENQIVVGDVESNRWEEVACRILILHSELLLADWTAACFPVTLESWK